MQKKLNLVSYKIYHGDMKIDKTGTIIPLLKASFVPKG